MQLYKQMMQCTQYKLTFLQSILTLCHLCQKQLNNLTGALFFSVQPAAQAQIIFTRVICLLNIKKYNFLKIGITPQIPSITKGIIKTNAPTGLDVYSI